MVACPLHALSREYARPAGRMSNAVVRSTLHDASSIGRPSTSSSARRWAAWRVCASPPSRQWRDTRWAEAASWPCWRTSCSPPTPPCLGRRARAKPEMYLKRKTSDLKPEIWTSCTAQLALRWPACSGRAAGHAAVYVCCCSLCSALGHSCPSGQPPTCVAYDSQSCSAWRVAPPAPTACHCMDCEVLGLEPATPRSPLQCSALHRGGVC